MAKKKNNWDRLKKRNMSDKSQYRNVHEDQQLDRSRIEDKESMSSRRILSIILTLFVVVVTYALLSFGQFALVQFQVITGSGVSGQTSSSYSTGYTEDIDPMIGSGWIDDATGTRYTDQELRSLYKANQAAISPDDGAQTVAAGVNKYLEPSLFKVIATLVFGLMFFGIMEQLMQRNLEAQNLMNDTSDINQYQNDQHIALPEEIQLDFGWFPDVGAHSSVEVSGLISHMMLSNKGLNKIKVARRAKTDILDEDGDIEYYKGEILLDDDGQTIFDMMPVIDIPFGEALFDASEASTDKQLRKHYTTANIDYNKGNQFRDKVQDCDTIADLINNDWIFPEYEVQRPAGAYIVDTEPINTMVLAITRAGKGQTVIEPTIDMWTREINQNNIVINDPKGELLVDFYVRGTVRGFQIVQFNLINPMKTDIYNPLGLAADAAREGDSTKCAQYVENIANVFFPLDGGDDPVWPNAANNAFKRAAYGLIDYYLEEEKELRLFAERTKMDEMLLVLAIDEMWGKVTLYNCYQLFVQLTSKKLKNPTVEFQKKIKAGEYSDGKISPEEYEDLINDVAQKSTLWEDKPETDLLTLFFNATDKLPQSSMRTLVANANNALRAMAGAEKMMASVYGIAITAMSFFTDPTISTLTSGTSSQNVDLSGLSFPRRLGVRFNPDFVKTYHLAGMQVVWESFEDSNFTKKMGKDFHHEDILSREGWAKYYFKGIYPNDTSYIRLQIINPDTGMLNRTFYFRFKKTYQTSLDSRYYVTDPVLGTKIVKNGILTEFKRCDTSDGKICYKKAKTTFKQMKIVDINSKGAKEEVRTKAITQVMNYYSEKPKMVFMVTPPHLMKYTKLILILIKQLVDVNFSQSYTTKSNQKPLYKTRYMLDELGNLQSEGHGISGFETMLSIGLGQDQQFTLILQTLQQLRDVYGDSVDKIVQGNTSNIVFLKSTDDSMIDTLQKMSGTTHRSFTDSKTVTRDMEKIMLKNEGKTSYTMTTREVPVIAYNDMAFIAKRNSIVFRAGDPPIWNRNETILPMSYRLFKDTIKQPGKDYTLQTIPTLSSAKDFDVRKNQPDFNKMLDKRMKQAYIAEGAKQMYSDAYDYSEFDIKKLDPDLYSDEVMDVINQHLRSESEQNSTEFELINDDEDSWFDHTEVNTDVLDETARRMQTHAVHDEKMYAGGCVARSDLMSGSLPNHAMDKAILTAYSRVKGDMRQDTSHFTYHNGSLCSADGEVYIQAIDSSADLQSLNQAIKTDSRVFAESVIDPEELNAMGTFAVTDAFYQFLVNQDSWQGFAKGRFDDAMKKVLLNG